MWFQYFPIHRGKGLLLRWLLEPILPPKPASFEHKLRFGFSVPLFYREDTGTKVLFEHNYEAAEIARMCDLIVPGTTVLDVGANIGLCSLEFAHTTGKLGRVIAFEPNANTANRLRQNLSNNGVENVTIEQVAVANQEGSITFHESDQPTLSSATRIPPNHVQSYDVPVVRVDDVWSRAGRPRVSLLKIDVEGGELAVLQGASELLAAHSPAIMLEAWGEPQLGPIQAHLARIGYQRIQPKGFESRNHLFMVPASAT